MPPINGIRSIATARSSKEAFGGQGLYVSPEEDLVIAYFGTHGYDAPGPPVLEVLRRLQLEPH